MKDLTGKQALKKLLKMKVTSRYFSADRTDSSFEGDEEVQKSVYIKGIGSSGNHKTFREALTAMELLVAKAKERVEVYRSVSNG